MSSLSLSLSILFLPKDSVFMLARVDISRSTHSFSSLQIADIMISHPWLASNICGSIFEHFFLELCYFPYSQIGHIYV